MSLFEKIRKEHEAQRKHEKRYLAEQYNEYIDTPYVAGSDPWDMQYPDEFDDEEWDDEE